MGRAKAKHIAVVAHSYGGVLVTHLVCDTLSLVIAHFCSYISSCFLLSQNVYMCSYLKIFTHQIRFGSKEEKKKNLTNKHNNANYTDTTLCLKRTV